MISQKTAARINRHLNRPAWVSPTFWEWLTWSSSRLWSCASRCNPLVTLVAIGMGISVAQALSWRI